jgi:hypothetical protein
MTEAEATETPSPAAAEESAAPTQPPRSQIDINDSKCFASYANFCRVTGTPEELIVDFGLNKQVGPQVSETIDISQRIIVNFFTAKRLLAALHMAVQRHEAAFGTLETDVQRRVVPNRARNTP